MNIVITYTRLYAHGGLRDRMPTNLCLAPSSAFLAMMPGQEDKLPFRLLGSVLYGCGLAGPGHWEMGSWRRQTHSL